MQAEIIEEPHVNPNPQHREVWLRDPSGYVVVLASPDGESMAELDDATIDAIVAHMNDDHGDSVADYARHYGGMEQVDAASLIGFDADAMRIEAYAGGVRSVVVVDFEHALQDAADARDTLIAMAREAARRPS